MKTLTEKLAALHAAEDAVRHALADLMDAATGDALAPGEVAFDQATRTVYTNEAGKITRKRAKSA